MPLLPLAAPDILEQYTLVGTVVYRIDNGRYFVARLRAGSQRVDAAADTPVLKALKLILSAWGRLEDEAGDARKRQLQNALLPFCPATTDNGAARSTGWLSPLTT